MIRLGKEMMNKTTAVYIALGILLVLIMTLIGTGVFIRVLEVEIIGTHVYTTEDVLEASRVSRGDNLMRLNAQSISQNIRSDLPFVRDVSIERRFPDTLIIEVVESVPIAHILLDGDVLVLDSSGRILKRGDYSTENLVEIRGIPVRDANIGQQLRVEAGAETRFQDMQEILVAFERESITENVSFLDVSNIQHINFGYRNLYRVILGNANELRHKLYNLRSGFERVSIDFPGITGDIDVSNPVGNVTFSATHETPSPVVDTTVDDASVDDESTDELSPDENTDYEDLDDFDMTDSEQTEDEN